MARVRVAASLAATGTFYANPCVVFTMAFSADGGVGTCVVRDGGGSGAVIHEFRCLQNTTAAVQFDRAPFDTDIHVTIANGRVCIEYENV